MMPSMIIDKIINNQINKMKLDKDMLVSDCDAQTRYY